MGHYSHTQETRGHASYSDKEPSFQPALARDNPKPFSQYYNVRRQVYFAIFQETNVKRSVGWRHPNLLHNYIEHEGLKNVGLTLGNIVVEMLMLRSSEMIILWAAGQVSRMQDMEWQATDLSVLYGLLPDKLIEMIIENVQSGLLHQSVLNNATSELTAWIYMD